jgi:A/G-specific adenine glycosylase
MHSCAARLGGQPESFPRKAPKREGLLRRGAAFVVTRANDDVLVRSRPPKGLLGGMTEVPTSEWTHGFDGEHALDSAPGFGRTKPRWRCCPGVVTHVFTHFPLELVVYVADIPAGTKAPDGMRWTPIADLAGEALPNVMRKVLAHAFDGSVQGCMTRTTVPLSS